MAGQRTIQQHHSAYGEPDEDLWLPYLQRRMGRPTGGFPLDRAAYIAWLLQLRRPVYVGAQPNRWVHRPRAVPAGAHGYERKRRDRRKQRFGVELRRRR